MKNIKIGDLVREGGPLGPLSRVIDFKDGVYTALSLSGNATGHLTAEYLYPQKEVLYEQLKLF